MTTSPFYGATNAEPPQGGTWIGGYSKFHYGHHVSWRSATQPAPTYHDPAKAFARIFGENKRLKKDASILDAVREDAARMRRQLSASDQRKLEEYEESIRSLERDIARMQAGRDPEAWQPPKLSDEQMNPPLEAEDLIQRWGVLLDLAVLAIRIDRTRVVTLAKREDIPEDLLERQEWWNDHLAGSVTELEILGDMLDNQTGEMGTPSLEANGDTQVWHQRPLRRCEVARFWSLGKDG